MKITLRPVCPDDEVFLFELYSSTRIEEVTAWGWDTEQQEAFLKMQFAAQQQGYRVQFPQATHRIVLLNDCPMGRIITLSGEHEIRLIDIALLPEHRGVGIGTNLIQDILAEAKQTGKTVRLHVSRSNRAIRLPRPAVRR